LVYLGTPELAVPPLDALHHAGFDIALVITRPDKRRGRGSQLLASPVKAAAERLGLPVSHNPADAVTMGAELGVVVAYGRIIATELLAQLPMVNVHFSLLPRWRGAAPVERAILAGDKETGVCLMVVAPELDTGEVYACCGLPVGGDESLDELRARLVAAGTELLVGCLQAGLPAPRPQEGQPVYAAKMEPEEHRLIFERPAEELHRVIRLGRAWCQFRGKRLKVLAASPEAANQQPGAGSHEAGRGLVGAPPGSLDGPLVATGHGVLRLVEVQPEGKRPLGVAAWLNGAQLRPGDRLG
jgi:methionyl-tRNA formyltransferase